MFSGLYSMISPDIIKENELMKDHTTFKIGGPADIMVFPRKVDEIKQAVAFCKQNQLPLFVFGLGSNILVTDKGIRGLTIKLGFNFNSVKITNNVINAQAGANLSELARIAANHSLSGLEFAEGIPGSLGGAVVMNAGAYDSEMKNIVVDVEAIDPYGDIRNFGSMEIGFSYRKSVFQENNYIVISTRLKLEPSNQKSILDKMDDYAFRRREKQPLDDPSAGSVFKRPPGLFVGPMVEELGLKGYRIGGAEVSQKHAGFIINTGNAKAQDVLNLIKLVQEKAKERFGAELKPEIRIVGEQ